eukprot:352579-Chlamydomonas_euryale.AAC.2
MPDVLTSVTPSLCARCATATGEAATPQKWPWQHCTPADVPQASVLNLAKHEGDGWMSGMLLSRVSTSLKLGRSVGSSAQQSLMSFEISGSMSAGSSSRWRSWATW